MLHRTAAVRVLASAWHMYGDTLEAGAARFNLSPEMGVLPHSNGVATMPVYARLAGHNGRGGLNQISLGLKPVSRTNALESLAPELILRPHHLHRSLFQIYARPSLTQTLAPGFTLHPYHLYRSPISLILAYPRPDLVQTLAPEFTLCPQRLHRSRTLSYVKSAVLAAEFKAKAPICRMTRGTDQAVNVNLPRLRSLAKLGADVGFSAVQTNSCAVRTKP